MLLFGMILTSVCSGNGGAGEEQEPTAAAEPHEEQDEHAGEHGHD
jgi:hypothetical protein